MGLAVGAVGILVGLAMGALVLEGMIVGATLEDVVGLIEGSVVGVQVGALIEGLELGAIVEGLVVGSRVDGLLVGSRVDGLLVGASVVFEVGVTDKVKEGRTEDITADGK